MRVSIGCAALLSAAVAVSCTSPGSSPGAVTPALPEVPVAESDRWDDLRIAGPLVERSGEVLVQQAPTAWTNLPAPDTNTRWFRVTNGECLQVSRDDFVADADRGHVEILGVGEVLESNPADLDVHDVFVHDGCHLAPTRP